MPVMIQIRNVPTHVHRTLKSRAARAGLTLSQMLLNEVTHMAERPSPEEFLEEMARSEPVTAKPDIVASIRALRDGRRR